MDYSFVVTPRAQRDLRQVIEYIGRDNLPIARQMARELLAQIPSLARFPRLGRRVPELGQETIRELIYRRYRIIYRIDEAREIIYVIRFWHAARDEPHL